MRHEKKFRIEYASAKEVRQVLLGHPSSFRTAYPDRYINSMYFDSSDLTSFQQNQDGVSERVKYRIRWYGEAMKKAINPQLEIKIRNNEFGKKEIISIPDFDLDDNGAIEELARAYIPQELMPKVITRYKRSYYLSHDEILRATIDKQVCYFGFNDYEYKEIPNHDPAVILELKCAKEEVSYLSSACQHIPFRIQKNSKYVNGIFAAVI